MEAGIQHCHKTSCRVCSQVELWWEVTILSHCVDELLPPLNHVSFRSIGRGESLHRLLCDLGVKAPTTVIEYDESIELSKRLHDFKSCKRARHAEAVSHQQCLLVLVIIIDVSAHSIVLTFHLDHGILARELIEVDITLCKQLLLEIFHLFLPVLVGKSTPHMSVIDILITIK